MVLLENDNTICIFMDVTINIMADPIYFSATNLTLHPNLECNYLFRLHLLIFKYLVRLLQYYLM